MRGVHAVAVRFERRPRRVERLGRPAELARDERDLGLGDDAARAGDRLPRAEGARRPPQQRLGAREIAELRHGDAAQRQRRRIVAQGDAVQRAERITRRERARRRRDQRVHANPATLVTPTVPAIRPNSIARPTDPCTASRSTPWTTVLAESDRPIDPAPTIPSYQRINGWRAHGDCSSARRS